MAKSDLPKDWERKKLGEASIINPRKSGLEDFGDGTNVTFVPMSAIDEKRGAIAAPQTKHLAEVNRGYTFFKENDVLFAKITPCMQNGKSVIARNLTNGIGFGSTEFHVLRPQNDVLPEWIFYFGRQKWLRDLAVVNFTGSVGQQRVPQSFLEEQRIPVPPLEEQKRIVARIEELLNRVEQAKSLRQKSLEETSAIMLSALHQIFSRVTDEDWRISAIEEFADVKGGKRLPKGSPFADGKTRHPYIRVIDFKNGTVDQSNLCYISEEIHKKIARYTISKNDVYISIAGTIGLVGTIPDAVDSSNLTENAAKLVLRDGYPVEKRYLVYYLSSPQGQKQIETRSMSAGQPKLALKRIQTIKVPLPLLEEEHRIVAYFDSLQEKTNTLECLQEETSKELESITQSILTKAFKGEL